MRMIDADALKEKWMEEMMRWSKQTDDYCDGSHWTDVYADFIQELNETPTVDAVEVIRCKDCKYCTCCTCYGDEPVQLYCEKLNEYSRNFEFYCAYAVEKGRPIEVQLDELSKGLVNIMQVVESSIEVIAEIREEAEKCTKE